ncbi:MAG TPA: 2-C-methyl-D-erythritol 2,4-cyclodiphosphate synthase [Tepidisphaeraceae bacterium]|nr:2-C-methyl-D-erythritol 2,4-cyclodiphosphate synthase [Tepidisphaeraceae bacterium]
MTTPDLRIGHGFDLHRLRPGGRLVLGGVVVSTEMSPIAHSDGDVVIHALVDAVLGAIGAGDIGEHFPDSDPRWKGQASSAFLAHALALAGDAGFVVANADVTILAERPRLKAFKPQMVANLTAALRAPVNVKAGTNEGVDAVGRGEAIAAHAVVLLAKSK